MTKLFLTKKTIHTLANLYTTPQNCSTLAKSPHNCSKLYTTLHKSTKLESKLHKTFHNSTQLHKKQLYTTIHNFTKLYTTSQTLQNFINNFTDFSQLFTKLYIILQYFYNPQLYNTLQKLHKHNCRRFCKQKLHKTIQKLYTTLPNSTKPTKIKKKTHTNLYTTLTFF